MRNIILTIILLCSMTMMAQEHVMTQERVAAQEHIVAQEHVVAQEAQEHVMVQELAEPKVAKPDSIDVMAYFRGTSPLSWAGFNHWFLHPGINIQLETSVFAEFGKNARHGVGFAQNISMLYATNLLPKLSLSLGGGIGCMMWQSNNFRELNLSASLNYQFNERLEGFIYGQKSLVQSNHRLPWYLQDTNNFGDRIGVGAIYKFSPHFSFELRFEERFR